METIQISFREQQTCPTVDTV